MLAQELGDWKATAALATKLYLSEADVANAYWEAMQWARRVTAGK
jgi:hypothetical protein